jgi:hypothetical protein
MSETSRLWTSRILWCISVGRPWSCGIQWPDSLDLLPDRSFRVPQIHRPLRVEPEHQVGPEQSGKTRGIDGLTARRLRSSPLTVGREALNAFARPETPHAAKISLDKE